MKHLQRVSVAKRLASGSRCRTQTEPGLADAKTDFMNAVYRAWSDFVAQKKTELA